MWRSMRNLRTLQVVVLMSLATSSVVVAGPITGDSLVQPITNNNAETPRPDLRERETAVAFDAGSLFDVVGMPLLRLAAPIYLPMTVGSAQTTSGDTPSVVQSLSSDSGGASFGNVGFQPATDLAVAVASASAWPTSVPEPSILLLAAPAALLVGRRVAASRRR
jgi:hypothetical protein